MAASRMSGWSGSTRPKQAERSVVLNVNSVTPQRRSRRHRGDGVQARYLASVAVATPKAAEKNRSSRRKGFCFLRGGGFVVMCLFAPVRSAFPAGRWPPWQHGNARPSVRCPEVETWQIEAASRRRRTKLGNLASVAVATPKAAEKKPFVAPEGVFVIIGRG